jgi:hypothetical protein
MTHRDPVKVVASVCSLIISLSGTFTDGDHAAYIRQHWADVVDDAVTRVMAYRDRNGDKAFYDLRYDELVADPVGSVRGVYEYFGDEFTPEVEAAMARYAAENRQGKYGRHTYTLEALGLDRGELEDRFAAYRDRYDVARESVE